MNDNKYIQSIRQYKADDCCVFRKTKEEYGGLSNMASGFPLRINNHYIYSSEALYQACRFPDMPEVQREILAQASPMTAKMKSKPFRKQSRADWEEQKITIMRWCLKVKLAQNFLKFGLLLEQTYFKSIVEDSLKDDFWGAKRQKGDENLLIGVNALGRLLMELREKYYSEKRYELLIVNPPPISNFFLLGETIGKLDERADFCLRTIGYTGRQTEYKNQSSDRVNTIMHVAEESSEKYRKGKQKKGEDSSALPLFEPRRDAE